MKALSIIGIILALLDLICIFRFLLRLAALFHSTGGIGPIEFVLLSTPIYFLAISIVTLVKAGREGK